MSDTVPVRSLIVGGQSFHRIGLPEFAGDKLQQLPYVLRILLENVLRNGAHGDGDRDAAQAVARAISRWLIEGNSREEIPFRPTRILMHDTTCVPALVDIAAMRSHLAELGRDPTQLNPILPIDVSVDHSVAVDYFGTPDALQRNMQREFERNAERYRLLKWATQSLHGVRVHPPGTGIMHTINLERLATVVTTQTHDGEQWLVPDTLIGTDSHTPMINGIGVLAWGVGGLEAESVMFGMPLMLRIPEVVGVRLIGALPGGITATDLALTITQRLRSLQLAGKFVEFFGPGVSTLSAGARAVVANMAPEYGASTGYFPIDAATLKYLAMTGRTETHIERVEQYSRVQHLWFDAAAEPRYSAVLEIDLEKIDLSLAGPRRPNDRLTPAQVRETIALAPPSAVRGDPSAQFVARNDRMRGVDRPSERTIPNGAVAIAAITSHAKTSGPQSERGVPNGTASIAAIASRTNASDPQGDRAVPNGAVAIAAITSCTNTSDPRLVVAAALLARSARKLGLRPQPWVKTSFAPGSPSAQRYLRTAGLLEDLEAIGFGIVGYGCTTCIGNSGPLTPEILEAMKMPGFVPVAVLSGNRNFPGRVHQQIDASYLASPPLVVAYALAGDVDRDISAHPIAKSTDGRAIYLRDLWPTEGEIDAALHVSAEDLALAYDDAERNPMWEQLQAPASPLFPWDAHSTYLRRPPFASIARKPPSGPLSAAPIMALGDDITTDHISPAGAIPAGSDAATHLIAQGESANDLNVFASRRGNWEVMLRGLFTNAFVRNSVAPNLPPGTTLHTPSNVVLPLWLAAQRYAAEGLSTVVIAGERYGTGSSRDWAAKGLWLLGVSAVLALSFERIHRSNLIGMGILPLRLPTDCSPAVLALKAADRVVFDCDASRLTPGAHVQVTISRPDKTSVRFTARAEIETRLEIELLKAGGILPYIIERETAR